MQAICENYSCMTHPQNISSVTVFFHRRSSHVSCIPQLLLILLKELGDEMPVLQSHSFTGCSPQDAVCWLLTKKLQLHFGVFVALWEIPHGSCLCHLEEIVLHFLVIPISFQLVPPSPCTTAQPAWWPHPRPFWPALETFRSILPKARKLPPTRM